MMPITGISFIDATSLPVCHNRRIERHRVFDGLAARGKTSMGWFFGFKLHLVVNNQAEWLHPISLGPEQTITLPGQWVTLLILTEDRRRSDILPSFVFRPRS